MGSNRFGKQFSFTTWGESHGKAIGVVIDGCPAGLALSEEEVNNKLRRRAPGRSSYTSPRVESDQAEILSGLFDGVTTGTPISIIIPNRDADSSKYEPIKDLLRPGHANYPYLKKYGVFDYRGGGRASGRETACRVAAGAIASKVLEREGVKISAYIKELGAVVAESNPDHDLIERSPIFCADPITEKLMLERVEEAKEQGDSLGAVVELYIENLPVGLGEPLYEKLDAQLAAAMMGIPAVKGVEIGSGFEAAQMKGSDHNDEWIKRAEQITMGSNNAGGVLAGLSTGDPLIMRVVFKPTSSIRKKQKSVDLEGNPETFSLPEGSRHDPCVAIRGVPVVEAMASLVLVDLYLLNQIRLHTNQLTEVLTP